MGILHSQNGSDCFLLSLIKEVQFNFIFILQKKNSEQCSLNCFFQCFGQFSQSNFYFIFTITSDIHFNKVKYLKNIHCGC